MNPVIFKPSPESSRETEYDVPPSKQFNDLKREVLRAFRMHRILALAVGVTLFALVFTFGLQRAPYYETNSLIYVQPAKAKVITDASGGTYDSMRYDTYIQQQLQTIVRSDILSDALKSLKPDTWTRPGESEQSAITRLQHDLKVERDAGSYQLSITLDGGNPTVIANIVNAVTNSYIRKERLDELAQTQQQLEVLLKEQARLQTELASARQQQAALSSSLGVADTSGENGNPYDTQLGELRTQLASARAAHAVAEAQLSSLVNHGPDSSGALKAAADDLIASDSGLSSLKQSIATRRSKLVSEMAGLTPKNPLYKQDEDELQRLDQSLENMTNQLRDKAVRQLQEKLKLESNRTADVVSRLQGQLAQQTSIATGNTPKLQQAADLAAQITRLQAQLTEVDSAVNSIQLENQSSGLVHLLLPAEVPLKPKASKKIFILIGAFPFAFLAALATAFLKQKMDPRIYIGEDIEKTLGFPPMAVLPDPQEVDGKVLDEFMLRFVAGLDQAHSTSGARTYVFTAASANMNITDLVSKVAARMDKLGYRTMILKASSALQNLTLAQGSADKKPDVAWDRALLDDPDEAGETRLAKPGERRLMRPRRESFVAENLEKLKQNIDLLFIEALPMRTSTEAEFAARLADITVLIAESAQTTRDDLTGSLAVMQRLSVPGVATVLNDIQLRYADDDFIAVTRSVESRQSEVRRRETGAARHSHEDYQVSIYDTPESTPQHQASQFQTAGED